MTRSTVPMRQGDQAAFIGDLESTVAGIAKAQVDRLSSDLSATLAYVTQIIAGIDVDLEVIRDVFTQITLAEAAQGGGGRAIRGVLGRGPVPHPAARGRAGEQQHEGNPLGCRDFGACDRSGRAGGHD